MLLSTGLMARGRQGTKDTLVAIGQAAEAAGLARVWFGDHVVYPVDYAPNYPGGGRLNYNPESPQLDVLVAMTIIASVTERVGVGTSVVVIAQRNPVWFAKQIASLDAVSGGRVALGIGVGWCREEFEALGVPFERRGARTDEYVDVLRTLWTDPTPSYDGEFVKFPPLYCNPKPTQPAGPEIWIGGYGEAAFDRVARYGVGLVGGGTPELVAERTVDLQARARALGRADADDIGLLMQFWIPDRKELGRQLRELREAGLKEACIPVQGKSPEEARDFVLSLPELLD
jgi:probable F420-dependent oxidoreductase